MGGWESHVLLNPNMKARHWIMTQDAPRPSGQIVFAHFPRKQKSPESCHGDLLAEGGAHSLQALGSRRAIDQAATGARVAQKIPGREDAQRLTSMGFHGGGKGLGSAGCQTHLEVSEVPGAIVILATLPGEGGPEVHLD